MNEVDFSKTYLFINALLVGAGFLFLALSQMASLIKVKPSHRQLIQISQILLLISIAVPIVFHFLPKDAIPKIQESIFHSFPEMSASSFKQNRNLENNQITKTTDKRADPFSQSFIDRIVFLFDNTSSIKLSLYFFIFLAIGIFFASLRLFKSAMKLYSVLNAANPIRSLGKVKVVVSEVIAIPFSARSLRTSWVVLPSTLLKNGNDLCIALRHELQHHRQKDTVWAVIIEILICFFFLNPIIYLWKRKIIELQEFSCDEAVIGRKRVSMHEYGSCLVRVAEAALGNPNMYVGTTCMAAISKNPIYLKSFLRRRIEMFAINKKSLTHRWVGISMGTIASVLLVTIAFGADLSMRRNKQEKTNPGQVVVHPEIQKITDRILAKAVQAEKAKAGFAIVADPNTGKVLAVSNVDTTKQKSGYWVLSEQYEPASVIKALVVSHAIEKGLTTSEDRHTCENGSYRYGDRIYHDWKKTGWESLSTEETIAWSSDICTMKIAEKINSNGLLEMLQDFGFGPEGTARSYPQSKTGELPVADQDPQRPRIVPYVSMGVGFFVTPIEVVQAFGAIANGGNLMVPINANVPDSKAQVIRRVLSSSTSEKMRAILQKVVEVGTAMPGASKVYTEAGKTGTAHYPRSMPYDPNDGNFAEFIGFSPVKDPRIEIYVGIIDPESESGAHGGGHAAPVFKSIAEEVLQYMKVAPDKK